MCDASCLSCSGPSNIECTSCPFYASMLVQSDNVTMQCMTKCPDGMYTNLTTGIC